MKRLPGEAFCGILAYRYDDILTPGASTTALADLNVTMTGYACGAEDGETLDTAWDQY